MTSLNRVRYTRHSASAALVPLVLIAAVLSSSLSLSMAAGRPKTSTKKPSADDSSSAAPAKSRPKKVGSFDPSNETVELFDAVNAGQVEVKLIPKDSTQGRVFIKNKTKKPLNVKLPEAFAASPVLAQMGGGGGQGMGGGMGGMGGGGMGMGGGFFNVPAEKEGNFKVPCMCLEHGKPEPRPAMTYKLAPIETLSKKPGVEELCRQLGYGKINQRAAQVAAWHLNNEMSWQTLTAKRIEHADGSSEPYFTEDELREGMLLAHQAVTEYENHKFDHEDKKPAASPGETAQSESPAFRSAR